MSDVSKTNEELLAKVMDTLAYYHCRAENPKADHPRMGYHAMSEDQREFLQERQREAAEEILRMIPALSRATVPDAAPTLCVECNEVEVLGKPEHRVLCMDCAYETGRAAVPDAATETERDAALAAIERVTRAKLEVDSVHQFHGNDCLCGFSSARSRSRTEHITGALLAALDGAPEPEVKP